MRRMMMRRRMSKTVFVPEEWCDDDGSRLLLFVEGPAGPRSTRFLR